MTQSGTVNLFILKMIYYLTMSEGGRSVTVW